jgi:hypothetical protein
VDKLKSKILQILKGDEDDEDSYGDYNDYGEYNLRINTCCSVDELNDLNARLNALTAT